MEKFMESMEVCESDDDDQCQALSTHKIQCICEIMFSLWYILFQIDPDDYRILKIDRFLEQSFKSFMLYVQAYELSNVHPGQYYMYGQLGYVVDTLVTQDDIIRYRVDKQKRQFGNTVGFCKYIGHGGFGYVTLDVKKGARNCVYATKTTTKKETLQQEYEILRKIQDQTKDNTDQQQYFVQLANNNTSDPSYRTIELQYCPNGDLEKLIRDRVFPAAAYYDDFQILMNHVMHNIIRGVSYLHDMGIIHLDLKPRNIFIDENGVLKIGDFGSARLESDTIDKPDVDPVYASPEALFMENFQPRKEMDWWSVGLIMYACQLNSQLNRRRKSFEGFENATIVSIKYYTDRTTEKECIQKIKAMCEKPRVLQSGGGTLVYEIKGDLICEGTFNFSAGLMDRTKTRTYSLTSETNGYYLYRKKKRAGYEKVKVDDLSVKDDALVFTSTSTTNKVKLITLQPSPLSSSVILEWQTKWKKAHAQKQAQAQQQAQAQKQAQAQAVPDCEWDDDDHQCHAKPTRKSDDNIRIEFFNACNQKYKEHPNADILDIVTWTNNTKVDEKLEKCTNPKGFNFISTVNKYFEKGGKDKRLITSKYYETAKDELCKKGCTGQTQDIADTITKRIESSDHVMVGDDCNIECLPAVYE